MEKPRGALARHLAISLFVLCTSASWAAAAPGYVGGEKCKTCHADKWFNFNRNPHYKSVASGKETPEHTGCESCHGPGEAHVKADGGKTTIPRAFSLMSPKRVMETCLECHAKDVSRANIQRSEHSTHDIACTACHSIHKPATPKNLLAKQQTEMCYGCHTPVRAQFSLPSKHRVNEGFMQCTDCHNPHGSFAPTWKMSRRPRMTAQGNLNDQPCLKCHQDKRGPFVFEHAPVRADGCMSCHVPHGSSNAKLLTRPVVFTVCLECHTGTAGFGTNTQSGIPLQDRSHNMMDPKYQKCTMCHVRIHGSNASQTFFR